MSRTAPLRSPTKTKSVLKRNARLFDIWSIVHIVTGVALGWIMPPIAALIIMILWEPLELFVISPIALRFGSNFGYEALPNTLSDIVFDALGVAIGAFLVTYWLVPPFYLR